MKNQNRIAVALVSLSALVAGSAHALLPAEVTTGITALETDVLALQAAIWPVLIGITVGFLLMKFFKRGSSKI